MMADTYPPRNLPEQAQPWGRAVEDREIASTRVLDTVDSNLSALNRDTAAQLAQLSRQAANIPRVSTLVFTRSGFAISTAFTTVGSLVIPTPGKALVSWNLEAVSLPGPDGAYLETRALYNGFVATTRWMGWGDDFANGRNVHSASPRDVASVPEGGMTVDIQVRASNSSISFPTQYTKMDISVLLVSGAIN